MGRSSRRRADNRRRTPRDRTRPDLSRSDTPWAVVGVIGDADGPAFGYTNGLHGLYDHPELWMSGVAADGQMEWCTADIGYWLNVLARMVRDGESLVPGGVVTVDQPQHDMVLEFTIGEPADRLTIEALLTEPQAMVLPVRWVAMLLGQPPAWPVTAAGAVRCPCAPATCDDCAAEAETA